MDTLGSMWSKQVNKDNLLIRAHVEGPRVKVQRAGYASRS